MRTPKPAQPVIPARTPEELRTIATGIHRQLIFHSRMLDEPTLFPTVFLPLGFLSVAQLRQLRAERPALFFGYYTDAGYLGVNGYPILGKVGILNEPQWQEVLRLLKAFAAAEDAIR